MADSCGLMDLLSGCAERYPFPVASAYRRFLDSAPTDPWKQWEMLSRDVLQSVLNYLVTGRVKMAHSPIMTSLSSSRKPDP